MESKLIENLQRLVEGKITCPDIEACLERASGNIDYKESNLLHTGFYDSATLIATLIVIENSERCVYTPGTNYKRINPRRIGNFPFKCISTGVPSLLILLF